VDLFLATHSVDINPVGENGETLTLWTIRNGLMWTFNSLLSEINVDYFDTDKVHWADKLVLWASKKRGITFVKLLLYIGRADGSFKISSGRKVILFVAGDGQKALVKLLLESRWSDELSRGEAS
jgi:ankyrin repeat protein